MFIFMKEVRWETAETNTAILTINELAEKAVM